MKILKEDLLNQIQILFKDEFVVGVVLIEDGVVLHFDNGQKFTVKNRRNLINYLKADNIVGFFRP